MAKETVLARAKLNLTLDVLGKRPDGYHDLRMVMQSVALSDTLTVETGTGEDLRVRTDLSFLPNNEKNLAAAAALSIAAGHLFGEIVFQKQGALADGELHLTAGQHGLPVQDGDGKDIPALFHVSAEGDGQVEGGRAAGRDGKGLAVGDGDALRAPPEHYD